MVVSPLGPTISEFYISDIENKIFKTIITKPKIYVRYVDNIFIVTHSYDEINKLKQTRKKSLLNFTTELNINYLYVLTDPINNNKSTSSPYKKSTNDNSTLLTFHSECPPKYKITIIKTSFIEHFTSHLRQYFTKKLPT